MSTFSSDGPEHPLLGGDVTEGLVRAGDTVRRPAGAASARVRVLLEHLERVGFTGAPRWLGTDDRGRDVLDYIEGDVAGRPAPDWVADDARAVSVAVLLREFHEAVRSFGIPPEFADAEPPAVAEAPPLMPLDRTFIGHRDITLENVVFRDGRAHALIDFDLARASSRVEEVCNLLQWWAPWQPVVDRAPALRNLDVLDRSALLVDAYGMLTADERAMLVPVARNAADRTWFTMRLRAERDGGGWKRMWDEGVGDAIIRRQEWLAENAEELSAAVAG